MLGPDHMEGHNQQGRLCGFWVGGFCDHESCTRPLVRSVEQVCGGQHSGGPRGCGGYFCADHLYTSEDGTPLCHLCRDRLGPHEELSPVTHVLEAAPDPSEAPEAEERSTRGHDGDPACTCCGTRQYVLDETGLCPYCQPCPDCGEQGGDCPIDFCYKRGW